MMDMFFQFSKEGLSLKVCLWQKKPKNVQVGGEDANASLNMRDCGLRNAHEFYS